MIRVGNERTDEGVVGGVAVVVDGSLTELRLKEGTAAVHPAVAKTTSGGWTEHDAWPENLVSIYLPQSLISFETDVNLFDQTTLREIVFADRGDWYQWVPDYLGGHYSPVALSEDGEENVRILKDQVSVRIIKPAAMNSLYEIIPE